LGYLCSIPRRFVGAVLSKMALRLFSRVSRYRCMLSMASRACLSTTQGEDLLINKEKYSFIKDLGLKADNDGVFNGTWGATGKVCRQLS
jgi:aldehyde dehydrogenase family 7 protein A1